MDQADYMDAGSLAELPTGRARALEAAGRRIALFRTACGVFALDNTCPHRGGPLSEGDVIGNEIVCPWHLWGFDLATGRCPGNPEVAVATHEVRLDGDRILVKVMPSTQSRSATSTSSPAPAGWKASTASCRTRWPWP